MNTTQPHPTPDERNEFARNSLEALTNAVDHSAVACIQDFYRINRAGSIGASSSEVAVAWLARAMDYEWGIKDARTRHAMKFMARTRHPMAAQFASKVA
jgi:hypothetical protein